MSRYSIPERVERINMNVLKDCTNVSLDTTDCSIGKAYKDAASSPFKIFKIPEDQPSNQIWACNVARFNSDVDIMKSLGLSSLKNPLDTLRSDLSSHQPSQIYDSEFFALIDSLDDSLESVKN